MNVLIAGGGVAGLTLAQGLRRRGIECQVLERLAENAKRSGYRLTLDADGGQALEACLPPELFELYQRASHRTPRRPDVAIVIDQHANELSTAPHIGPPNTAERPHTAIDRTVFRQVLSAGLDDVIRYDSQVTAFTAGDDAVEVELADGTTDGGDVLVAADGVGSAVRRRRLPDVAIVPAPVGALGMFGRAAVSAEEFDALPEILSSGFVIARDDRGVMLTIGGCVPRQPPHEAAAQVAPYARIDPTEPYVMLSGGIPPDLELPSPSDWTPDTGRRMHAAMRDAVAGWHPAIRGLVDRIDPDTLFSHPFRRLDPTPPWSSSRVTLVGDAIHAMLPTLGKGANMAMRNAAVLRDALAAAAAGERPLLEAIAAYEEDMRQATYPLMELASDHGNFGGGGLRRSEEDPAAR